MHGMGIKPIQAIGINILKTMKITDTNYSNYVAEL